MNELTLSERHLKAIYGNVRGLNMVGGRFGIADSREPKRYLSHQVPETTDENTLTYDEMRDLELRLAECLFSHELPPHPFAVGIG
jgi:hypothetical protein